MNNKSGVQVADCVSVGSRSLSGTFWVFRSEDTITGSYRSKIRLKLRLALRMGTAHSSESKCSAACFSLYIWNHFTRLQLICFSKRLDEMISVFPSTPPCLFFFFFCKGTPIYLRNITCLPLCPMHYLHIPCNPDHFPSEGKVITLILQRRKVKFREVKQLAYRC